MAELPQPDMSHLTPEERRIIEGVLMRQKEEEEQDHEIMRRKQDEVQVLEETIRMRSEKHKKAGVELNATCHICLKTKFADGVGHICNYCDIRCCARCGGKVTLRSSKVIWVCILCRKKQELLSKTGQWMTTKTGLGAVDSALLRQMQEDLQVGGRQGLADQTRDKRPKLERAHSAAEKENLPLLQRSGNCPLRRQYSQQEQISGRRMSTSDSGVEMSVSPHARTLPTPHVVSSYPVQQTPRHPAAYPDDDPNLYRGEIDGLMRQHPPTYQRQRSYQDPGTDLGMTYGQTPMETSSVRTAVHPSQQHSLHQTQSGRPAQSASTVGVPQQRSFSSSEEERSTPECASDEPDESEKGKGYYHHAGGPKSMSSGGRRHNGSHNGHHGPDAGMTAVEHNGHHPPREPRKEESTLVRRSFRRCGDEWRADSRRFTERRGKKTVRFDGGTNVGGPQEEEWSWEADRQGSQDSATKDSGIDTSSTFTSSEDSNRGDLPKHPLTWQVSEDGQKIIGHMVLRKTAGSGSSSSILGLKVVGGKLLEDGSMGALIEKVKEGSTADIEGDFRPGDEVISWSGRSLRGKSFREVSDIIAESRLEPQIELVVERKLSSTTTGMAPAGPGPSTPMASRRIVAQSQWRQKHETISGPPTPHHKELYDARREKPSVLVTSPGSPDLHAQGRGRHSRHPTGNANVGGSIQVKLGFDPVGLQLIVTIICAAGLTPKSNGQPRNPYAKVFLLPDKSEKSKRRTKTVANTNDPRWNQTFVYNGVRRSELRKRALEITVWDYARYEANDFLGEAVLELAVCLLDDEPEWHSLTAHGEHRHVRHYQDSDDMIECHLSPLSTASRLSDSDTSECDITDCDVSREQRRTADGASISSIGSSSRFHNMPSNYKRHYSSPPPERELCIDGEHRSRRDMSPQGRKRAALMISRDQPASISSYQTYRKDEIHRGMMGHRSHSAAPMDSPSVRYRGRSQSPTGHRSLSPPEHRSIPYSHGYVHPRFGSRSATATPTGSPKKRQLPQIPAALKERVAQDFGEPTRFMRHRNRQSIYRSTGMGGWERHYSGLSDSDLPSIGHDPLTLPHSHAHRLHRSRRGHLSPDKDVLGDLGDSDMESIASVTSSAFSTQSERPRGSRALIPTVKNVLIPGAISPIPPPPRRNRRRHKFRIPCSECHCPTKPRSNNPSKCPTLYPLVRSKSAVVRSLYKKMCTPFTRSQTVDENMLRYYSSETSEYSVSEGYILKPERLVASSAKNRIPATYIEDCLRVDFNDRFVEKFRSKYSAPYLAGGFDMLSRERDDSAAMRTMTTTTATATTTTTTTTRTRRPIVSRDPIDLPDHLDIRSIDARLHPRRSFLSAKTRSFDYDVMHDTYGDRFGTRPGAVGLLSRRAKSFEYESISSNIFSDDSLRTARRKLKRNLSLSDAGYGDKIPALDDQSKSYFDSNGDDKVPTSLASKETNYDFLLDQDHKPFYGYDSELSCGETEIYVPSFDKQSTGTDDYQASYSSRLTDDNDDLFSANDPANLRNILDKDDTSKRKYMDGSYLNHDSSYIRDISSETRTKSVDSDPRNSIDNIYCSIEEALSSSKTYDRDILARSATKIHDATNMDEWMPKNMKDVLRSRGAINRSYQEDEYKDRESWDADYDEGFIDREKVEGYEQKQFSYLDKGISALRIGRSMRVGEYFHDETKRSCTVQGKCYAQSDDDDRKLATSDYTSYRSSDDYEYTHSAGIGKAYDDGSIPRRRRRRSRRGSKEGGAGDYEHLRARDMSGTQFRLSESKRLMTLQRTESTPTLHSDEELSSTADRARRMYRRKRNISCPESRDLRMYRPRGNVDERTSSIVLDSDEEFGSMETVVGADYFRRTSGYVADARPSDGIRSSLFDAEQDRGSYLDARYDHEDRYQDRSYPVARGLVRSGSQRSSREARHASRARRKSSCPECRELALSSSELGRSGSLSRKGDDSRRSSLETKHRYRRRNSSCPEARDLEMLEKRQRQQPLMQLHQQQQRHPSQQYQQQQQQQQHQQQYQHQQRQQQHQQHQQAQHQQPQGSSKRNVAISDTLEYYEYSMESESQCSENCGFGPCDPRRPRNRAPRPGNANSSLFDSQTATSDTAKNYHPRIDDHHHQHPQNTKTSPLANVADVASTFLPPLPPSSSSSARRRPRKKSAYDVDVVAAVAVRRDDDDARNRRSSSMPESSEYTSQSSSYEKTSRRQVTDNGHDEHDKRSQFTRSLSNADVPQDEKDTGSYSDTAIALNVEDAARRARKSSPGSKSGSGSSSGSAVQYQAGLGKKSNSTSQLSATECGGMMMGIGGTAGAVARGAGLTSRKRNSTPSSIQRSEEIMPAYQRFDSKQAGSAASDTAGSLNSISSSEGSSWSPSLRMAGEGQLRDFIEDLGPGQVVGRQALGARCLGEIQLSLSHTKGYLEVEVIRAKDLKAKQGSKVIPAPYVKLYLVNGKRCIEKAKTLMARKTLDPFYQQLLAFKENCRGCILQVTVWGDYGRLEGKKVFMGIAQIVLDELDLSQMVFGWYKLFDTQAL
ncbi:PREDICTED: regulating synaptic membrane exocytosis protein 2-like [Vollenhovia emeryi]|uniref:regulating synaptic membrane exocytosis protein 2-like n=1 Tax=Vollenhovia emeryi TaxID=411798 RepID=UPI0005F495A3|nr:PREDICTED: regulating synaptic membrane exocytosis protein 2-like [Vollenhovia emeryi]